MYQLYETFRMNGYMYHTIHHSIGKNITDESRGETPYRMEYIANDYKSDYTNQANITVSSSFNGDIPFEFIIIYMLVHYYNYTMFSNDSYRPGWFIRFLFGPYNSEWLDSLIADVLAGITVALTLIPQGT